jgi:phosphate transport system substrate-binding protein
MRTATLFLTALFFCVATSAIEPAASADGKLVITGSSTIAPLASEIARRFEEKNPNIRVDVQSGGSSRGVSDARSGLADIGMVSRALKPDELDLKAFAIALDGVGLILHRDNPVSLLSDQQIIDIYTGKTTDWATVGGNPGPITVVTKAEGRSTLELFLHHFKLKVSDIKAQVVIGDNQQGIKTVAGNRAAIGYVSIGTAEFEAGAGTPIKLLGMAGVAATVENVRNETFPLSRPLNLVTSAEPQDAARAFIDFAQSPEVHDIVKDQFFVPLGP